MPNPGFYRASYGNVRLWISRLSTTQGRTLVVHEMSAGADHVIQDRGPSVVVARGTLLFDYMVGDLLSPVERLNELKALVDGDSHTLTHPTVGSYTAMIGPFEESTDESGTISADVEFTATQRTTTVISAGAASIPASGEGAVNAAVLAMSDELGELGIDDGGLADSASVAVDAWASSVDLSPREVFAQVGTLTDQLGDQSSMLEDDIETWEAFKRTLLLADSIRSAAEAMIADGDGTSIFRVGAPIALRALLASEYGAVDADRYYNSVMAGNDIATPGLLEPGYILQLPNPPPRARNG